jgi:hypothetical protein
LGESGIRILYVSGEKVAKSGSMRGAFASIERWAPQQFDVYIHLCPSGGTIVLFLKVLLNNTSIAHRTQAAILGCNKDDHK